MQFNMRNILLDLLGVALIALGTRLLLDASDHHKLNELVLVVGLAELFVGLALIFRNLVR